MTVAAFCNNVRNRFWNDQGCVSSLSVAHASFKEVTWMNKNVTEENYSKAMDGMNQGPESRE